MQYNDQEPFRNDAMQERSDALEQVLTFEPQEFSAIVAYRQRRDQGPSANAEGVYVGDIFSVVWGDKASRRSFFQVADVIGAHDIVVRENEVLTIGYGNGRCLSRPIRDCFTDDSFTLQTQRDSYWHYVFVRAPEKFGQNNLMTPCNDCMVFDHILSDV